MKKFSFKFCLIATSIIAELAGVCNAHAELPDVLTLSGKTEPGATISLNGSYESSNPLCKIPDSDSVDNQLFTYRSKDAVSKTVADSEGNYVLKVNFKKKRGGFCSWKLISGVSLGLNIVSKSGLKMMLPLNMQYDKYYDTANRIVHLSKNSGVACSSSPVFGGTLGCRINNLPKTTGPNINEVPALYIDTDHASLDITIGNLASDEPVSQARSKAVRDATSFAGEGVQTSKAINTGVAE